MSAGMRLVLRAFRRGRPAGTADIALAQLSEHALSPVELFELPYTLRSSAAGLELTVTPRCRIRRIRRFSGLRSRVVWDGFSLRRENRESLKIFLPNEEMADGWALETPLARLEIQAQDSSAGRSSGLLPRFSSWIWVALGAHFLAATILFLILRPQGADPVSGTAAQVSPRKALPESAAYSVPSDFSGLGLWDFLRQKEIRNTRPEDLAGKIQGISSLVHLSDNTAEAGSAQTASVDYRSLRSGIQVSAAGTATPRANGPRIQWRPTEEGAPPKKSPADGHREKLLKVFGELQDEIRGCYESALSSDEDLAVTVSFEATVSRDGHLGSPDYQVSGKSTPSGQKALLDCLTRTLSRPALGTEMSGVKVRNQFIFKS